jgi:hypothetical protein
MEIDGDDRSSAEIMQLWDYLGRRLARDFRTMLPTGMFLSATGTGGAV